MTACWRTGYRMCLSFSTRRVTVCWLQLLRSHGLLHIMFPFRCTPGFSSLGKNRFCLIRVCICASKQGRCQHDGILCIKVLAVYCEYSSVELPIVYRWTTTSHHYLATWCAIELHMLFYCRTYTTIRSNRKKKKSILNAHKWKKKVKVKGGTEQRTDGSPSNREQLDH